MAVAMAACLAARWVERKALQMADDWVVRMVESMVAWKAVRMVASLADRKAELSAELTVGSTVVRKA